MGSLGQLRTLRPRVCLVAAVLAVCAATAAPASPATRAKPPTGTYYVSPSGSDAAAGTSPETAWRTLAKVSGLVFGPGAQILLEGGKTFNGGIVFDRADHGTASRPISVGSYGQGRATIRAASFGISIQNTSGIEISDLEVVGPGTAAISNPLAIFGAGATASDFGIGAVNDLAGNVKLPFLRIHDVEVSHFGDVGVLVDGNNHRSGFEDVRITRVVAHDNVVGGIVVQGESHPAATSYAHADVQVSSSLSYENRGTASPVLHTGDGIVLSDVDGGTVERCVAHDNGRLASGPHGGPVGIWTWDSNRIVIQHNRSYRNQTGGSDGGGFDLDGGVTNSVLQHNVSYDNAGPGYLAAQFEYARPHRNNVVRYNTSRNDARQTGDGAIVVTNGVRDLDVYGNTVSVSPRRSSSVAAIAVSQLPIPGVARLASGIRIEHNAFETRGGAPVVLVNARHRDLTFAGNAYVSRGAPVRIVWDGKTYRGLAAWRAATGEEPLPQGRGRGFWIWILVGAGLLLVGVVAVLARRRLTRPATRFQEKASPVDS